MKKKLIIFVCFVFIPNCLYAYCAEPITPLLPSSWNRPSKPSVPFCVNEYTRTHTCDEWTINMYERDVENYNSEVSRYARELQEFVDNVGFYSRQAYEYAECELRLLN